MRLAGFALLCAVLCAAASASDDEDALSDVFGVNYGDGDGDGFVEVGDDDEEDDEPPSPSYQPSTTPTNTDVDAEDEEGEDELSAEKQAAEKNRRKGKAPRKAMKKQKPAYKLKQAEYDAVEEKARVDAEYDIVDTGTVTGEQYTQEDVVEHGSTPKRTAAEAARVAQALKLREVNPETERDNESVMPLLRHLAMGSQNGAPINIGVCYSIKSCKKITKRCRKHGISQHHARMPGMPHELTPDVCINAELRLASLRYPKETAKHSLTNLIPLSQLSSDMGAARLENFFSGPVFASLATEVDALPAVHAILTDPRRRMYPNITAEAPLAHVNCNGVAHLFTCRMAVHAALRMVGHDVRYAWVLWERLGHYWRAQGYAYFALQCFRKALDCSPHEPNVMYSIACVMHQAGFTEEGLATVEPLVATYPQYVVYQITTCQLLSALAHGKGQFGDLRSLEERLMRARQGKECYDGLVTRYPGLTGIEEERDKCLELSWMLQARLRMWEFAAYTIVLVALLGFGVYHYREKLCFCFKSCRKGGSKASSSKRSGDKGKKSGKAKAY